VPVGPRAFGSAARHGSELLERRSRE
jgi:hypothetical protein